MSSLNYQTPVLSLTLVVVGLSTSHSNPESMQKNTYFILSILLITEGGKNPNTIQLYCNNLGYCMVPVASLGSELCDCTACQA